MKEHDDDTATVSLMLGGDVMLGRGVADVTRQEGPHHPLAPIIETVLAADQLFVNLECPITSRTSVYRGPAKRFYFRAEPRAVATLHQAGVKLVSLANNHAMDSDVEGLRDTITHLQAEGIEVVGAGDDILQASAPRELDVQGIQVGVLAFCDHQADFGAGPDRPGIRYVDVTSRRDQQSLIDSVEDLSRRVDHAVVAAHWMPNWVVTVPRLYRHLARSLVEAGASVIWGHSPHHFLGVEWIEGRPVLYATGGLVDDYAVDRVFRNDRQLLFKVTLSKTEIATVSAYPMQLVAAQSSPAGRRARTWITGRFVDQCHEFGTPVRTAHAWLIAERPSG